MGSWIVIARNVVSPQVCVQFEETEGCDAELKLLVFFLKTAKVLEKVVLYFRPSAASSKRVRQEQYKDKLRAVPTASSSIKMVFKIE